MIPLVDGAGSQWPVVEHALRNGCNLAGLFLLVVLIFVGLGILLSLKVHAFCLLLLLVSVRAHVFLFVNVIFAIVKFDASVVHCAMFSSGSDHVY